MTRTSKPEALLQEATVRMLRDHGVLVFSVPNERNCGIADALRMRATGLTKGAPDLVCWTANGVCWWLELKAPKGVRTPEQKCFEAIANKLKIKYQLVKKIPEDIKGLLC